MKRFVSAVCATLIAAVLVGCGSTGSDGSSGSTGAEDTAAKMNDVMTPMFVALDIENIDEETPMPDGVSIVVNGETGVITITFVDYSLNDYTYNGKIFVSITAGDGFLTMGMSGALTISGMENFDLEFEYSLDLDGETGDAVSFSGYITIDGTIYDLEELAPYLEE